MDTTATPTPATVMADRLVGSPAAFRGRTVRIGRLRGRFLGADLMVTPQRRNQPRVDPTARLRVRTTRGVVKTVTVGLCDFVKVES